jgi:hypothetical protein
MVVVLLLLVVLAVAGPLLGRDSRDGRDHHVDAGLRPSGSAVRCP